MTKQLLPRVLIRLRTVPPRGYALLAVWAAAVFLLERFGRRAATDLEDLAAAAAVGVLLGATLRWHRRGRLGCVGWVEGALRRAWRRLRSLTLDVGVDLRQEPPYPRGVPPLCWVPALGALAGAAVTAWAAPQLPAGLRGAIAPVAYTLYLLVLVLLWGVLVAGTLVLLFLPCAALHDFCVRRHERPGRRRLVGEAAALAVLVSVLVGAGLVLPPRVAVAGLLGVLLVTGLLLVYPGNPALTLVWRRRRTGRGLRSLDYRWFTLSQMAFLVWASCALGCTAAGASVVGREAPGFSLTVGLGHVYLWVALGAAVTLGGLVARSLWAGWRLAAVRETLVAYVYGAGGRRGEVRRLVRAAGWRVRFPPARRQPADVALRLVPGSGNAPPGAVPVTVAALREPATWVRLRRRDEVQKRRLLVRGLEKLFKRAARRRFRQGEGFWIGLQHWYVLGLSRDTDEEDLDVHEGTLLSETVGPPYHRVFPGVVRRYYARVMRALELDLIFVEDGVGFRRLRRVLRVLFEIYDIYGGRQRAEEKHFVGIPGVRVLIHDVVMGQPWLYPRYPEPDYEDVGRARILHVFKDRGGEEEPRHVPGDRQSLPVTSPVG